MQRWKIWTAFLTVFAAGVIVGVAGLGLVLKHHFAPPRNPAEFHQKMRRHMVDDFMESVRPDAAKAPAIRREIESVFDRLDALREDTRPRIEAILKDGEARIKAQLTREQAERFDRLIKDKRRGPGLLELPPPPPPGPRG
ncbi:hypothetical protein [Pseudodesulfovibrio sp.]|uniref:hypothetical protein n=1 Tax=Pseudodesulfovibrio sp. TaxID=2035812 RepID=UPI00262A9192|nr:hypothetical protein [Pseudodesulfovibrio sp.]MDD3312899.1 hypothetical protein [Pseudodesulfovibrio sp.]